MVVAANNSTSCEERKPVYGLCQKKPFGYAVIVLVLNLRSYIIE